MAIKVNINGYTVEIKAKRSFDKKYNLKATQAFLNELACDYIALSDYKANDNKPTRQACAKYAKQDADAIYEVLENMGYYNKWVGV